MTENSVPKTIGIIAAPGWYDPSADELREIFGDRIRIAQTILGDGHFDYSFSALKQSRPLLERAIQQLVGAKCDLIIQVGPAFSYMVGGDLNGALALQAALSNFAGTEVILNGAAIFTALQQRQAKKLLLICPYYDEAWRTWYGSFLQSQGFNIVAISGFLDQGIFPDQASIDQRHYQFSGTEIQQCIERSLAKAGNADAIVISGSGVRTHPIRTQLARLSSIPIIAADQVLVQAIEKFLHKGG